MAMKTNVKIVEDIQKYFLLGTLLLLIFLLFIFVSDFLGTLFIAALIVSAIYPFHRLLVKRVKTTRTLSTLATFILVTMLIIVPLTLFSFAIVRQATGAYASISVFINEFISSNFDILPMLDGHPLIQEWIMDIIAINPISAQDIIAPVGSFIGAITTVLVEQAANIVKHATVFILHVIIFFLAIYFFIRDGEHVVTYAKSLIPLQEHYRDELFKKIRHSMRAIIFGTFGAAIAQGFFVYLGFKIVGIENAAFWGALAGMFSPVPYIGPTVVWFPVVLMFFFSGQWMTGIFLWIWGGFVVGTVDNVVKSLVIGSGAALHPLAVLLVILGGIFVFGFKGLIFGPLVLTLTLAFLHIYKLEYQGILAPTVKTPIKIARKRVKKTTRKK